MNDSNGRLNKKRRYLIEETAKIIEENGLKNVSARKIAQVTGYTSSSTIYNYFDELSHLLHFSAMRFIVDYLQDVKLYMDKGNNYLEKYILSWECFCKHSFLKPDIYYAVFISDLSVKPEVLHKQYYTIFDDELDGFPNEVRYLFSELDFISRNKYLLQLAADEQSFPSEYVEEINSLVILTWKGMLMTFLNNRSSNVPQEATEKTMEHIKFIVEKISGMVTEKQEPRHQF